jgi:3-deoxy-manno-octulosonate cytidylyltransferase (CMP-KDO synthetase)
VIPARLGATRLPEKPLRLLGGEPLIRVVARRALSLELGGPVVVASDDRRVLEAVAPLDVAGVLTGAHRSGTDRVAEVARRPEFAGADVILNLQGDEPFLPRAAAAGAVSRVLEGDDVGTAAQPLSLEAWRDPRRVKVELDRRGRALRFFRTPEAPACSHRPPTFHHVGVYAYRPDALARWTALPLTAAEESEGLEQLRPLARGWTIGVATLTAAVPHGIDTEDDLRTAEALL